MDFTGLPKAESNSHLLDVQVSKPIASGYFGRLVWVSSDQLAEEFDGRSDSVHPPFKDAQLPEVGPSVAGQRFAVFKVEPTKIAGSLCHEQEHESRIYQFTEFRNFHVGKLQSAAFL